jgi:hypothetical protein
MERTRAAALLTVEPPVPELDEDVALLRAVDGELRLARREQGREPAELLSRRAAVEQRIRRSSWTQGSAPSAPSAPSARNGAGVRQRRDDPGRVRELLAAMPGEVRLAELAVVGGELHAVVTSAAGRCELVRLGPLAPVARDAESALFALRRGLRGGRFAAAAQEDARACFARLRRALVEPLAVPDGAELIVVPAGPLHRVPWTPLHDGPLTLTPSAALWARTAAAARTAVAAGGVALVAGPGLVGAVTEVGDLVGVHPEAALLLPPASTVEETVRLVTGADLAHLACHGRLRTDNPLFSALELSDGALTVHELLARGVAPRRMVLAACDSGADGVYHGNEVLGFVSALMARGTTAVLASVLPLPDGASISIMRRMHERLRAGDTMGVALHRARAAAAPPAASPTDPDEPGDPGAFTAWCGLVAYGAG